MQNRKAQQKRQTLHNENFHTKLKAKLGAKNGPVDSKATKRPLMHKVKGKAEREKENKTWRGGLLSPTRKSKQHVNNQPT